MKAYFLVYDGMGWSDFFGVKSYHSIYIGGKAAFTNLQKYPHKGKIVKKTAMNFPI
jgi:hypothetical protein